MKEFKPTSWAIDNRTTVYLLTIIITVFGVIAYNTLQKEKFPDIVIPTIYIGTAYPGTSPADMENLVTRPLEKQIKAISGVKKVSSTSVQDFSSISVEFNAGTEVSEAKQKVKDAVDKSRSDLPTDLPADPNVLEINFADFPILYVNISGDYEMEKLKRYAEDMEDRFEALPEITRVDVVGALDKEIQVNVDLYKAEAAHVTLRDIQNAIASENLTVSGGTLRMDEMSRSIRIVGQYKDPSKIGDIIIKNSYGSPIQIRDIAQVQEGYKERESFARLDHKPVITLNIIKRSGENLIDASDKIRDIVKEMQESTLPADLAVTLTGDQSTSTRNTLNDLINTIIIGFILVTLILMFFMGTTNAIFVGLSVPLSTFVAFLVLQGFGFSMNMIVLFSFLLALGIVVDDAIVVIENTHRIYHKTKLSIIPAAKEAAGEVFWPVFAGTLTTLAPFIPLLFWPGIVGKFMYYLPFTLIFTLLASLMVAFIINPVFAVSFMRKHGDIEAGGKSDGRRSFRITLIALGILAAIFYASGSFGMGNFLVFLALVVVLNRYVFTRMIDKFQHSILPRFMNGYERLIKWMLYKRRPYLVLASVLGLLILSFVLMGIRSPKVVFFPQGDPNFIYVYVNMPVGTDVNTTDSVTQIVEGRVFKVIGEKNPDVESIISNVAVGASDPSENTQNAQPHKGKVSVAFKEFAERSGEITTQKYLDQIREEVKGIPGAEITVDKEQNGPPTGKPINIEVSGEDYPTLIQQANRVERFVDSLNIAGIEDLRSDLQDKNPEVVIDIDRERANREGISTRQIAIEIRNAVFGFGPEASKFKMGEDEYPIQVRLSDKYRDDIDALANLPLTFREMSSGKIRQVPISSVATIRYGNTYGGIKRKNLKKVITLSSNVLSGANANEINVKLAEAFRKLDMPAGYEVSQTGEQEDQKETGDFLGLAGLLAICLILLILVLQFNSISKPVIILSEILFSITGVLLGFSIFGMDISIVMTGVGIVALAGIVVKNGILLVEFADELKTRGHEQGKRTVPSIIKAGSARLNPVLLTATATVLGLVPLALGMNINFFTLFTDFDPQFYIGGESQVFWGPLAWTIIFGLTFATFLTLLVVPVMYLLNYRLKVWLKRKRVLSIRHRM